MAFTHLNSGDSFSSGATKSTTIINAIGDAVTALQQSQFGDAAYVLNPSGAGVFTAYASTDGSILATGTNPGTVINSAITYTSGLTNGGSVALPNGTIQLTTQNLLGLAGVRLRGQGMIQQSRAGNGYGTVIIGPAG